LDELDRYCTHQTARSSGPGGQSVNTTDSKVLTRFNPNPAMRAVSQRERSQHLNRKANLQKLHNRLVAMSTPATQRIDTKPTRASQAKRLAEKTHRGTIKRARRQGFDEE
jgi:ribosome-associated protein